MRIKDSFISSFQKNLLDFCVDLNSSIHPNDALKEVQWTHASHIIASYATKCVNTYMHYADSLRVANLCFSFQIYVLSYAVKGALSERKSEICKYVLWVILHALCDIDCIFLHKTLYIVSFALLSKIPKTWSTGVKVFQQRIPCSSCIQKVVKFSHSIIDLTRARHFSLAVLNYTITSPHPTFGEPIMVSHQNIWISWFNIIIFCISEEANVRIEKNA